ncbi:hypothetical protein KF840_01060 [bacterium]|nr:hypothetical protein [bacterium]
MRLMGVLVLMLVSLVAPAGATTDLVKDPDGKTLAVIVDCNSCQNPASKGAKCETGAENGFNDGKPCGKCLLDANYPTRIPYAYDLQFTGHLKDENGEPLKGKFVRLYLPNTWTVRTRTTDDGTFRLLLGATVERKGKAQIINLGDRVMPKDSKAAEYALFMLPENYKPCGGATPKAEPPPPR